MIIKSTDDNILILRRRIVIDGTKFLKIGNLWKKLKIKFFGQQEMKKKLERREFFGIVLKNYAIGFRAIQTVACKNQKVI